MIITHAVTKSAEQKVIYRMGHREKREGLLEVWVHYGFMAREKSVKWERAGREGRDVVKK